MIKKSILTSLLAITLSPLTFCLEGRQTYSTIAVEPGDSKTVIINKAAHVVPKSAQLAALEREFIAFVHFGPNTFTRKEWGDGMEDPKVFNLQNLDTDQWCQAMKDAGMELVVFTAKHHDGFVLWQSRYTDHGVMSTDFMGGKGDVLRDLSASCEKYGLKLGVYLSPADLFQIENPEGIYGNLSKATKRTIPREVDGRPFENKTTFEFTVDDYNEYFLNQLFELLTEYGEIHEIWLDGAHPKRKGGQQYDYLAWKRVINTLAPNAVIFGREDVRWCGNESGQTRSCEFNIIPYLENPTLMNRFEDLTADPLAEREQLYGAKYLHYQQAEVNTSIREGWFYRDDTRQRTRSADDVFDIYERSVGGNSTFLLNIPPNREGEFSQTDVDVLVEVGKRIRATYGVDLFSDAKGKRALLDDNTSTYFVVKSNEFVIETPTAITINRLSLQEAIATHSERVESFAVDAMIDGGWRQIAQSTNIGYRRIVRFPEITTSKVRVRILESRLTPAICNVSAHYYKSHPPRLTMAMDVDGNITLAPYVAAFMWKPHGENPASNLNAGVQIYYTTDGSDPDSSSMLYTKPFKAEQGELKAVAYINGERGTLLKESILISKKDWTVVASSGESENKSVQSVIDANSDSYWMSNSGKDLFVALDLGAKYNLQGFVYTPQTHHSKGMMAKGVVKVSCDGESWTSMGDFDFGNLINDPTRRFYYFKDSVEARFIRLEITEISEDGDVVTIAELDVF